ncbi:flagellar FliL protein [Poseidonocella pacifica]|uniref:Flagellar protein FliL n=1 Tax=Poseidonocella pacifica TaxID=871651 RepID=A0A1I0XWK6_9RHOB|nr:flagellar basal body-associated FliL family protein [Poseidonocella pacifica]SFB05294.1 flagellar FliL protein [Poseidonocella pacifica]
MADEEPNTQEVPKKSSKLPLIIGLVLGLAGGGGGFFAAYAGLIPGLSEEEHATPQEVHETETELESVTGLAFVPVDPMVVSIGGLGSDTHLRFRAQLEVPASYESDVTTLMPRIVDVLNNYLRALELADLESNAALVRLRSQMLRRVKVVAGEDRVRDLLVMEFVMN